MLLENEVTENVHTTKAERCDGDWVDFLFSLGKYLEKLRMGGRRIDVTLVVPAVDFVSLLIASGMVFQQDIKCPQDSLVSSRLREWIGATVSFSRDVRGRRGGVTKKKFVGILQEIRKSSNGEQEMVIKCFERVDPSGVVFSKEERFIKSADFPLVDLAETPADLEKRQRGESVIVGVSALQLLFGNQLAPFLASKGRICWIMDKKVRLIQELEAQVPLWRLIKGDHPEQLLLRDLIRPDLPRWPAVAESFRTHIGDVVAETADWKFSIIVGALPVVRYFEQAMSQVRVAVISPTMTSFREAVEQATRLFQQRQMSDIVIPDRLLAAKPASFDIQIWEPFRNARTF